MPIIAHLDMDAFFAAVEERDNPQFAGLPIAVGADPRDGRGRGVVSTANYEARMYGIHSATPISTAWRLSQKAIEEGNPEVIFLPVDMEKYLAVSQKIMKIVRQVAGSRTAIEPVGMDEAYLDLSTLKSHEKAQEICQKIRTRIKEKEHLTASFGIGPNKLIAKIASDMEKPEGLTIITKKGALETIAPLPIRKIPGIGPKTEEKFKELGVETIEDLRKFSKEEMGEMLGKWGLDLYEKARGRDSSPVVEEKPPPKSIGEQETFQEDTLDPDFIFKRLSELCQRVIERYKDSDFTSFKTVVVTVRFSDFQTKTRTQTLKEPASSFETLRSEAMKLILPFLDKRENPKSKPIRLLGVRIEKLE